MTAASSSGSRALVGERVIITRASHQAAGLRAVFEQHGAQVAQLPLLEICAPRDPTALQQAATRLSARVSGYQWLMFTSANAIEAFFRIAVGDFPPDVRIAVVGKATAAALGSVPGTPSPLIPRDHDAEGLLRALGPEIRTGQRVLLPQAADARPTLSQGLAKLGLEVDAIVAYDKVLPAGSRQLAKSLLHQDPLGWVTFTSPRIVRHFLELLGETWQSRLAGLKAASIGPITSTELRRHGIEPTAEALRPGDGELAEAVVKRVQEGSEATDGGTR